MTPEEIAKMDEELVNLRRWNTDLAEQLKASCVMDIPRFKQTINKLEYEKAELERKVANIDFNFRESNKHHDNIRARCEEAERRVVILARSVLRVRLSKQVAGIVIDVLSKQGSGESK